jgi:hypothetical protein
MRVAVFAGDLFWSSCPYEHLNVAHYLGQHCNADLVMFEDDIRLNKKFTGEEKFRFDPALFAQHPRLRTVKSWDELVSASSDYDALIANCKIAPKTRTPSMLGSKGAFKCPVVALDVGGTDQLTDCPHADIAVTKSPHWADKVSEMWSIPAVALGCHQYDYYHLDTMRYGRRLQKQEFAEKYGVDPDRSLLIAPTNPNSHLDMYRIGMMTLDDVCRRFSDAGYSILVKTYPHDYVFREREAPMTGVYRRTSPHTNGLPQYEHLSKTHGLKVVESQDHHAAVSWCRYMYNMSGSHIGWETHFTGCRSFSIGYKKQSFFGRVTARGRQFDVPDPYTTIDLDGCDKLPHVPARSGEDREAASVFMSDRVLVNSLPALLDWIEV